jgi:hypothetical protein
LLQESIEALLATPDRIRELRHGDNHFRCDLTNHTNASTMINWRFIFLLSHADFARELIRIRADETNVSPSCAQRVDGPPPLITARTYVLRAYPRQVVETHPSIHHNASPSAYESKPDSEQNHHPNHHRSHQQNVPRRRSGGADWNDDHPRRFPNAGASQKKSSKPRTPTARGHRKPATPDASDRTRVGSALPCIAVVGMLVSRPGSRLVVEFFLRPYYVGVLCHCTTTPRLERVLLRKG